MVIDQVLYIPHDLRIPFVGVSGDFDQLDAVLLVVGRWLRVQHERDGKQTLV